MATEDRIIPPYYGLPKRKEVQLPTTTPWTISIVRINERSDELERLNLVAVPYELNYQGEAQWQTIGSIGRNNPFYNYTGGEDTLEFTIDWYSKVELKDDVIRNCRWLESLTRADAYSKEPDRVILLWGELFRYTTWIVAQAPYRLSIFNREQGLLPTQAYQDVVLKKVIDNNTSVNDRRAWPQ